MINMNAFAYADRTNRPNASGVRYYRERIKPVELKSSLQRKRPNVTHTKDRRMLDPKEAQTKLISNMTEKIALWCDDPGEHHMQDMQLLALACNSVDDKCALLVFKKFHKVHDTSYSPLTPCSL